MTNKKDYLVIQGNGGGVKPEDDNVFNATHGEKLS